MTPDQKMLAYKYIEVALSTETFAGKPLWHIINRKAKQSLGTIFWCQPWQRWTASFAADCVFSTGCLTDIINAIGQISHQGQIGGKQ